MILSIILIGLLLTGCKDDPETIDCLVNPEHESCEIIPPEDPDVVDCDVTPDDESCEVIIINEPEVIEDNLNIITYASGVAFSIFTYNSYFNLPQTYIDVTISDISYSPLRQQVCFSYDIHDPGYARATYYIILQDTVHLLTREQIIVFGGSSDFSGRSCVNVDDKTLDYRIVIGKDDLDNLNPTYGYIEGSAWIEFSDSHKNERKHISIKSYTDTTPDETTDIKYSSVAYSLQIEDLDRTITRLEVYLRDTFDNIIDAKAYDSTEIMVNDKLTITNDFFSNLAPNVDYKIEVYATGNDGVDDFEDAFLFIISCTSSRFPGQSTSHLISAYHGLYAVIYDVLETEDSVIVSYVYSNENMIQFSDNKEKVVLHMTIYDKEHESIETYAMEIGDQSLTIPLEYIGEDYTIHITDQREVEIFDIYVFYDLDPKAYIYGSENQYELRFDRDSSIITNIDIKLFVVGYAVPIEEFSNFDFRTNNVITIYHDLTYVDHLLFEMTVTYIAYGKEYTVITTKSVG